MKVCVADFRATGNEHLVINSAIIEGLQSNGVESIDFFAENAHLIALAASFPNIIAKTTPHPFHNHHYRSRLKTLFFREILLPFKLIRVITRARSVDLILITTITPFGHLALNALAIFIGRRATCVSLMHSELEVMEGKRWSLSRKAMRIWRNTISKRVNYVVLSPHIEHNIELLLHPRIRMTSIFHPFPTSLRNVNAAPRMAAPSGRKIKIGVPGLIKNEKKGTGNLFKLEARLRAAGRQDVELHLIGRAARDFAPPSDTTVHMPFLNRTSPVAQDEFDQAISEMDIILLMYDQDSYCFTASGAVLDALKFGQPLYAARNPLFDYMAAEGIFPGHLSNSVNSLFEEIVERLTLEKLNEDKRTFQDSFNALLKRTDPEKNVSAVLEIAN
jgi:hypothetical protein